VLQPVAGKVEIFFVVRLAGVISFQVAGVEMR
jgi:hypothetical protein